MQISLPSSCPRQQCIPHASLGLPASSVEDALPPLRYRPRSLLLQHLEPVEGARGGCQSAEPGQWRHPGHESSSHRPGTANPSPPSPLLGPLQCPQLWGHTSLPRTETGGRTVTLPRDCRWGKLAESGREGAVAEDSGPPPPTTGWGAGVETGKGRGPARASAGDAGAENFPSLQSSPRPHPAPYVTRPPQRAGRERDWERAGCAAAPSAQPRGAQGRRRTCFRGSGD